MAGVKRSARTMEGDGGRQYHIGLKNGELASRIILVGSLERVDVGRALFDEIELDRRNREFRTITGTAFEERISLMSTGIGPDNTEIAVVECSQIVADPIFIRVGSSGGIHERIVPGSLVVTTGALAFENTSTWYVPDSFPAVADHEVVAALVGECKAAKLECHVGLTATTSSFYGSQDRKVGKFEPFRGVRIEELQRWNVLNFEMEASCLFRLAQIGGGRAGAICVTFNNRMTDEVIGDTLKRRMEKAALGVAMRALARL